MGARQALAMQGVTLPAQPGPSHSLGSAQPRERGLAEPRSG